MPAVARRLAVAIVCHLPSCAKASAGILRSLRCASTSEGWRRGELNADGGSHREKRSSCHKQLTDITSRHKPHLSGIWPSGTGTEGHGSDLRMIVGTQVCPRSSAMGHLGQVERLELSKRNESGYAGFRHLDLLAYGIGLPYARSLCWIASESIPRYARANRRSGACVSRWISFSSLSGTAILPDDIVREYPELEKEDVYQAAM